MKITTCIQSGMTHMFKCVQIYVMIKEKVGAYRIALYLHFLIANVQHFFPTRLNRTFWAGLAPYLHFGTLFLVENVF